MSTFINIKAIVKEQMKKCKDVKCCEISLNLYMLCTRRKPSLLLDFCRFENSGLDKACLNAVGDGAFILKLDLDYFVFNKTILVSHLHRILTENTSVYIDISSSNPSPVLCSSTIVTQINSSVEQVLLNLEKSKNSFLYLENTEFWNLSTLFGVLLGFPVVYWYSQEQVYYCVISNNV